MTSCNILFRREVSVKHTHTHTYIHIYESYWKSDAFFFSTGIITNTGTCILWLCLSKPLSWDRRDYKYCACDEEVKTAVMKWPKEKSIEFYAWEKGSHSKVKHCYWEKRRLCWKIGMWSTDNELHFDVGYKFLCR